MENFVLYEGITNSPDIANCTQTHKGRRKGTVAFLAISSVKKRARAPVTNHVRFVSELKHPHVVEFMEWYETTNHLWLVFELCSGGDLDTLLRLDGALPESAIRQFAMDLVRALHYLHSSDIVYGDLCPTKVLIDNDGRMKLGDFCLAFKNGESLPDLYYHFVGMGGSADEADFSAGADADADGEGGGGGQIREPMAPHLDWLSPELVRGDQPCADYKSDLWSLGAILYQMFAGRPPFAAATAKEVADGIVYKELPPPRVKGARLTGKPSQDFLDLIGHLLDKDADARLDWPELISHPFWQGRLADLADSAQSPRKSLALARSVSLQETLASVRQSMRASRSHHPGQQLGETSMTMNRSIEHEDSNADNSNIQQLHHQADAVSFTLHAGSRPVTASNKPAVANSNVNNVPAAAPSAAAAATAAANSASTNASRQQRPTSSSSSAPGTPQQQHRRPSSSLPGDAEELKRLINLEDDSDSAGSIVDNPRIISGLSATDKKFDSKSVPVPPLTPDRLAAMSPAEVARHAGVLAQAFTSSGAERGPPSQKRMNLVAYATVVFSATSVTPAELARPLLASGAVANELLKQIRETTHADLKLRLCRLLAHLFRLAAPLLSTAAAASCDTWPLGESATQLTEMLREQFRNTKLKQGLLAILGELLVAISAGESALGRQVAKWSVPAMTVTQIARCLHSSEEVVTSHLACKIIEKACGYPDTQLAARFATQELGQLAWSTLRLATLDSLRICAAVSLSRMCRIHTAICQSVVDKAGLSSVLDCLNAPASLTRVQQSVLSMLGASLICNPSAPFSKKLSQDRDFLHAVLKQLESPNPMNRAKAFLIVDAVVRASPDSLHVCCNLRLLVYVERDSRRDTPGYGMQRDAAGGAATAGMEAQAHLYHCLELLIGTLCGCVPGVAEQILAALGSVAGRKHPSTAQAKQLRQWLPLTSVLAQLANSAALRSRIVQPPFLAFLGQLLSHCQAMDCHKTVVEPAVSHEEVISTGLAIAELLVLHPNLLIGCAELVAKQLLPPLGGLIGSSVVETRVVAMKIFAEMSCHLLLQDTESDSVSAAIDDLIVPQAESLLLEAEPAPCFLLKLLCSYCELKPQAGAIVQLAGLPQLLLQLLADRQYGLTSQTALNSFRLVTILLSQRDTKAASALLPDSVPALGTCFSELAAAVSNAAANLDPASALETATYLQAVLDPVNACLKVVSDVARKALQLRRTVNNNTNNIGGTAASTLSSESCAAEAERLLVTVRPLADLTGPLVRLLCHDDPEVDEQSLKALSHLASLFGGEHCDWLGPDCLAGFARALDGNPNGTGQSKRVRIVLRILKRFVATSAAANQLAPGLLSAESASGVEQLRLALKDAGRRADNAADAGVRNLIQEILAGLAGC